MASKRCLLLATTTAVKDTSVCYPCCTECYSKLLVDTADGSFWCGKCHSSYDEQEVPQRYRLSLVIADLSSLAHITVFGGALQPFFGTTAVSFHRHIRRVRSKALTCDPSDILSQALDAAFVGKQFWFGFSNGVNGGSSQAPCQAVAPCLAALTSRLTLVNGTSKPDSTMVASQMIRAGGGPFPTVVDIFNSLFKARNSGQDVSLYEEVSTLSLLEEKQDFRLSNTSAFFKCSGNTSVPLCTESNSCHNSCLLSCDREQDPSKQLSEVYASYSEFLSPCYNENKSLPPCDEQNETLPPSNDDNENLVTYGEQNETLPPSNDDNENLVTYGEQNETLPPSNDDNENLVTYGEQNETLPPSNDDNENLVTWGNEDETLPPCDDKKKSVVPWGEYDETLPPSDDGNETLPPSDDGNETLPPSDDGKETLPLTEHVPAFDDIGQGQPYRDASGTVPTVNGHYNTILVCGDKADAESLLHDKGHILPDPDIYDKDTWAMVSRDSTAWDIEILRNGSRNISQGNRSSAFDDSSFLLECDRMEATTDSYPAHSVRGKDGTQEGSGMKIDSLPDCSITVDEALVMLSHMNIAPKSLDMTVFQSLPQGEMVNKHVVSEIGSLTTMFKSPAFNKNSYCTNRCPQDVQQKLDLEDDLWGDWSACDEVDTVTNRTPPCEIYLRRNIGTTSFVSKRHGIMTEGTVGMYTSGESSFAVRDIPKNTPAKTWDELPESEDLAAFLGDFSDYGCAETNSESSTGTDHNIQCNRGMDPNSGSSYIKDLNGPSDLGVERLQLVKCLSDDSGVFGQTEDVQSNTGSQQCCGSVCNEGETSSADCKHMSNITAQISEHHVTRTDHESTPQNSLHPLGAEHSFVDLFDSFQSLLCTVESDIQAEDKTSPRHIILESQISSSPINRSQIAPADVLRDCNDMPKSVKFSRRLSAVTNVRLMDIRMRVAPNPASLEHKTPRSCLKRQSHLCVNKENHLTEPVTKPLTKGLTERPIQRRIVLPESEELFTPSPVTARETQSFLQRQVLICRSMKNSGSGASGFTQSTPLLFSQSNGSHPKSIITGYLQQQQRLPNVDVSVDLFASPDLFSQSDMNRTGHSCTKSLLSANLDMSNLGHKSIPGQKNAIQTDDLHVKASGQNFSRYHDGTARRSALCVPSDVSACSTELFSPDILGRSLPSQEWKESLRKNLFF